MTQRKKLNGFGTVKKAKMLLVTDDCNADFGVHQKKAKRWVKKNTALSFCNLKHGKTC